MKSLNDIANQLEADLAALRRAEEVLARFNGAKARGALGGKLAAALGLRNGHSHSNGNGNGHPVLQGKDSILAALEGRSEPLDRHEVAALADRAGVSKHYAAVLIRAAGWTVSGRAVTTTWHPPGVTRAKASGAALSELGIGEAVLAVAETLPTPFSGPRDLVTALAARGVTTSAAYCGQILRTHGYHVVGSGNRLKWARKKATKRAATKGSHGGTKRQAQKAGIAQVWGAFDDSTKTITEATNELVASGMAKKAAMALMRKVPAMARYGYLKADGDGYVRVKVPDLVTPTVK